MPSSYLLGNYPNPFNPATTIRLVLDQNARLALTKLLRIYNMLGRLVAVIDLTSFDPGEHEIHFNGCDFLGNPLPSGIYIIQLQVGDQISHLRICLMK